MPQPQPTTLPEKFVPGWETRPVVTNGTRLCNTCRRLKVPEAFTQSTLGIECDECFAVRGNLVREANATDLVRKTLGEAGTSAATDEERDFRSVLAKTTDTLVRELGGIRGLVGRWVYDINAAKPGSAHRLKQYNLITRMMDNSQQREMELRSVEAMTDKELQDYIDANAARVIGRTRRTAQQVAEIENTPEIVYEDKPDETSQTSEEQEEYDENEGPPPDNG